MFAGDQYKGLGEPRTCNVFLNAERYAAGSSLCRRAQSKQYRGRRVYTHTLRVYESVIPVRGASGYFSAVRPILIDDNHMGIDVIIPILRSRPN